MIVRYPQSLLIRLFRSYIERAPGWVLLTTKGRKTGLPREVLLPCERPFFVPFPTRWLNAIHRTVLRPLWVPGLRWWVRRRPVVMIHSSQAAKTVAPEAGR